MKYSFKLTGAEIQEELFVDFKEFSEQDLRERCVLEDGMTEEEVSKISDKVLFEKYYNENSHLDKDQYYLIDGELNEAFPIDADVPSVEDKDLQLYVHNLVNPENFPNAKYDWEELYQYIMDNYLKESNTIKSLYEFTYKKFKLYDNDKDIIKEYSEQHSNEKVLEMFIENRNYNSTMYIICHYLNAFPIQLSKYTTKYLLQIV